jgi:nucleotide-binding universal stress UspA family protein
MYRRILVPLDGSELSEQVVPYAGLLGRSLPADIELLRITEPVPPEVGDILSGRYAHEIAAGLQHRAKQYLDGVASAAAKGGAKVSCVVVEGAAAEAIVESAESQPGTLIAMSTHGRSGATRWVMGSVTDKVLHATSSPLLIIRPRDRAVTVREPRVDNIVAPLDGSSIAEQVLPHVSALAKALRARVTLLRVVPTTAYYLGMMDYPSAAYQQMLEFEEETAGKYLGGIAARLRGEGVTVATEKLGRGEAAGAIMDLASSTPNPLVAMTTHGRSGVGRFVLGSVADRVVRNLGAPVLVVRAVAEA